MNLQMPQLVRFLNFNFFKDCAMINNAVASSKSGRGKTSIFVLLAALCTHDGIQTALIGCDVKEPNANLFLKCKIESKETVNFLIPHG